MSSQPLVSVVIPAFNAAETLADTLRSALASTYERIEIIVVDDGSTDRTFDVARQFALAEPRIRLHRQRNEGLSAALNAGFQLATGDFIARLDADDIWHPTKLEKQIALARQMPHAAFIYTFARYIDSTGRVLGDGPEQRFPPRSLCRGLCESLVAGGSSALMRREAVEAAGFCDPALGAWEDLLMQLRISRRHGIAFVPEYLVGYRINRASMSADTSRMLSIWRSLRRQLKREFPEVSAKVHRWAHASRCAVFGEQFAWRGAYAKSVGVLAEAFAYDPIWTSRLLAFRIARKLTRAGRRNNEKNPLFLSCDPAKRLSAVEPAATFSFLKKERGAALQIIDERLARLGVGRDAGEFAAHDRTLHAP